MKIKTYFVQSEWDKDVPEESVYKNSVNLSCKNVKQNITHGVESSAEKIKSTKKKRQMNNESTNSHTVDTIPKKRKKHSKDEDLNPNLITVELTNNKKKHLKDTNVASAKSSVKLYDKKGVSKNAFKKLKRKGKNVQVSTTIKDIIQNDETLLHVQKKLDIKREELRSRNKKIKFVDERKEELPQKKNIKTDMESQAPEDNNKSHDAVVNIVKKTKRCKKRKNKMEEVESNENENKKKKTIEKMQNIKMNDNNEVDIVQEMNFSTETLSPRQSDVKKIQLKNKYSNILSLETKNTREIKKIEINEPKTLRQRMVDRLKGARFRFLNEQMYCKESKDAKKLFNEDPNAFDAYHDGYRQQVNKWPLNPLDIIIKDITTMSKDYVIADLGCGDARLSKSIPQKVHSFDLVSLDPCVQACDMSHTPLLSAQVNVVVFCLSLMGTNLKDYIIEANRILKIGGLMKIAEVESRFDDVEDFTKQIQKYGFKLMKSDFTQNLFYFIDFKKESDVVKRNKLPQLTLKPCLYKRR